MKCNKCGGDMIGDGYTTPYHCETLTVINGELQVGETGTTLIFEPDCKPIHCSIMDEDGEINKELTADQLRNGWHYCPAFDGLLTRGENPSGTHCFCGFRNGPTSQPRKTHHDTTD